MKIRILLLSALLFVFLSYGFAQEEEAQDIFLVPPADSDAEEDPIQYQENLFSGPAGDSIFFINSFVFNVDGITRPSALINAAGFSAGEEIDGLSNLERYVQNKQQLLINERVLESARIEYTIGQVREDGKYPVDLVVFAKDTWNIIAIPRPQYSSNSGFDITIKARDYNFLGTMTPLRLDLGYRHDLEGRNFFTFMLDSGIPFHAFGLDWDFNFDNYFDYRPDMGQPFYYKNVTGLSVALPFGRNTVSIGFSESLILNEENSNKAIYGDFQDGLYMSSNPYISWRIPTGLEIGDYGELTYSPGISATFNHGFPQWPLAEYRNGPFVNFSHSLGFGRIDWIGNFLKGYSASIGNSVSNDFSKRESNTQPLTASYSIAGTGHFIFADFFGISSRLLFRQWIKTSHGSAGDVLRGVLDAEISTDYMLSMNLDLNFRVLQFKPSQWFDNQKLRLFDFDLHMVPIMDAALSHRLDSGTVLGFDRLNLTAGLEAIVFPVSFRSLFLRVSFAMDIYELLAYEKKGWELFIGTELHY